MSVYFSSIPVGFTGDGSTSVQDIRNSLLVGVVAYFITLPLYSYNRIFHSPAAARKTLQILRLISIIESFWIVPLLYCTISLGPIITHDAFLSYGSGTSQSSWLYSYGRPVMGIVLISFGMIAGTHFIPRYLCAVGCLVEAAMDCLSAYQVYGYYLQMTEKAAPGFNYTSSLMLYYYWRDISSIAMCMYTFFLTVHTCCILGFWSPQLIPYALIDSPELDRCEIMRQQRRLRHEIDSMDDTQKDVDADEKRRLRKEMKKRRYTQEKRRNSQVNADEIADLQLAYNTGNNVTILKGVGEKGEWIGEEV